VKPLARELEEVAGGTFLEPKDSLHAKQFWWQVKVQELLKLLEGKGLVRAERHRDKAIVIQVVGVMVMVFMGVVVVVMMIVMVMVMVMVMPMVVNFMVMMMIVVMLMGGFFGIGLSDGLIQTAIAHLHIDDQRQRYSAMLRMKNFDILAVSANPRFHCL
jgi:hypothetical protein